MEPVLTLIVFFGTAAFVGISVYCLTSMHYARKYAEAEENTKRISYENGYRDGEKYSYSHGYDAGLRDASEDGYNRGYSKGHAAGYDKALKDTARVILEGRIYEESGQEKPCKDEEIKNSKEPLEVPDLEIKWDTIQKEAKRVQEELAKRKPRSGDNKSMRDIAAENPQFIQSARMGE